MAVPIRGSAEAAAAAMGADARTGEAAGASPRTSST
jgi:hypothetical protein